MHNKESQAGRVDGSHSISDRAMRKLGADIVAGKYQPGDRLLTEIESAELYGISRSAYREACRSLTAKGLLNSRQKAGTTINPRARWQLLDPEILEWSFQNRPTAEFVDALFELRLTLEPMAAGLAAQRRTSVQLADLHSLVADLSNPTLPSNERLKAKRMFHVALFDASQNEFLVSLGEGIGAAAEWTAALSAELSDIQCNPAPDHIRTIRAIEVQSSEMARNAATTLLLLAQEQCFRTFC